MIHLSFSLSFFSLKYTSSSGHQYVKWEPGLTTMFDDFRGCLPIIFQSKLVISDYMQIRVAFFFPFSLHSYTKAFVPL